MRGKWRFGGGLRTRGRPPPSSRAAAGAVSQGCREAWRVGRLGMIAKVQDYIHESRAVWMSDWVKAAMPVEQYDVLHLTRSHKIVDPKWSRQLSVWRNHATFWVYRSDGPVHRARRSATERKAS